MSIYSELLNRNPELHSENLEIYLTRFFGLLLDVNGKNTDDVFKEIISSNYSEWSKNKILNSLTEDQKMFFIIHSENWRKKNKPYLIELITEWKDALVRTKNLKINFDAFRSHYKSYKPHLIDSWISIIEENDLENENIDDLFMFYDILLLNEHFLCEEAVFDKKQFDLDYDREIFDELRYWNNSDNAYREGGGGQEWSDSSEFL